MALITQADLEARLGRSLTAEEASSFDIINNANQVYVEELLGTSVETVSETTRYFDGGLHHLPISPCTDVSSVKLVDNNNNEVTTFEPEDYVLDPVNNTLKTQITYRWGRFAGGYANVAVTAKFSIYGDSRILYIVKDALLEALSSEVDNSDNVVKESIEGYSVEFAKTTTRNALDKLNTLLPRII